MILRRVEHESANGAVVIEVATVREAIEKGLG